MRNLTLLKVQKNPAIGKMKKSLFLALISIILLSGHIIAQDNTPEFRDRLLIGIKAGVNYSNVYDAKGEDFQADPKIGFAGGVFIAIPLIKYLGIQPEFLFSQKGFRGTGTILGSSYKFTRTTSYFDVPLLISFKPSNFISFLAGPQYSYLLKQKDEFKSETINVLQEQEFKNDNIRKNIMCFTGGVDINIIYYLISARAGWDFQTNNGDGTSSTPRYKNVWYQLTLGYRF